MKLKNILFSLLVSAGALNAATAYDDLRKGVDLTARTNVTAAILNQLVDNGTVNTNKGLLIVTNGTPDIITNPRYTNWLWLDTSTSPSIPKTYSPVTGWTAASVGANTITSNMIVNGNVIHSKIADNAIWENNITNNAVTSSKIGSQAVTTDKVAPLNITRALIADGAVGPNQLTNNAVAETNIQNGVVTTVKLADGAVTAAKLGAGVVIPSSLTNGIISSNYVALYGISGTNLQNGPAYQVFQESSSGLPGLRNLALQYQSQTVGTLSSITTVLPIDNTVPLVSEGDQVLTVTITPRTTTSKLVVRATVYGATTAIYWGASLFRDGGTCVAAGAAGNGTINQIGVATIEYSVVSGSLSATTFTVRAGPASGTLYFNGLSGTVVFGGVMASQLSVTEIEN